MGVLVGEGGGRGRGRKRGEQGGRKGKSRRGRGGPGRGVACIHGLRPRRERQVVARRNPVACRWWLAQLVGSGRARAPRDRVGREGEEAAGRPRRAV